MRIQRCTLIGCAILGVLLHPPRQAAQTACSLLEPSHRAQYISFESSSESDVRLRLHNNSTCAIVVETADDAPSRAGAGKAIAVHYLFHSRRKGTTAPAYGWGDSVGTVEIAPKDSITFFVPLTRLKARDDVAVPFGYVWEGGLAGGVGGVGGVQHFAYFLWDDLPAQQKK